MPWIRPAINFRYVSLHTLSQDYFFSFEPTVQSVLKIHRNKIYLMYFCKDGYFYKFQFLKDDKLCLFTPQKIAERSSTCPFFGHSRIHGKGWLYTGNNSFVVLTVKYLNGRTRTVVNIATQRSFFGCERRPSLSCARKEHRMAERKPIICSVTPDPLPGGRAKSL